MKKLTQREKERFENCYKFQETIARFTYATFYFHEEFSNPKAQEIGEKINDLCEQIHDLINDLCCEEDDYEDYEHYYGENDKPTKSYKE